MDREELEKIIQFNNPEERDQIKQYFTSPPDVDVNRKTIIFSTPSETGTSYFRILNLCVLYGKRSLTKLITYILKTFNLIM